MNKKCNIENCRGCHYESYEKGQTDTLKEILNWLGIVFLGLLFAVCLISLF